MLCHVSCCLIFYFFLESRRDVVAEGIISAFQKETELNVGYDHESEEGAKLMKLLETAAEPEVLMAGMSSKELTSFASYKAKLEVRQNVFLDLPSTTYRCSDMIFI